MKKGLGRESRGLFRCLPPGVGRKVIALEYILSSPLKINLSLRVTGKKPDGLHSLCSLFYRIEGPESLHVRFPSPSGRDVIRVYNCEIPGQNIIFKALETMRKQGLPAIPLEVEIVKAVPPGTGLGAGSGNAAALVGWARRTFGYGILKGSEERIGADVPFLCSGYPLARVGGTGERMIPVERELPVSGCVLIPVWRSETAKAYRAIDEKQNGHWITDEQAVEESEEILTGLASGKKLGLLPNDFLPVLDEYRLEYETLFDLLETTGALAWGVSGSGSSLFALYGKGKSGDGFSVKMAGAPGIERILFWE